MMFVVDEEIGVSVERVFDVMADARNEARWNDQVSRSELVSAEPIAQGSRFVTVNRGAEYDAVISTYDRPRRLAFTVRGEAMDIDACFAFEAAGSERTRLHGEFDMRPKGFMRVIFPLMSPLVRKDFPKQMQRFKTLCEQLAASMPRS
jgi:hypothetical protein